MPSVGVKLRSIYFKSVLKHKLLHSRDSFHKHSDSFHPSSRRVPANASFVDGVATKDVNIDFSNTLALRIFLPESALPDESLPQVLTDSFGHLRVGGKDADANASPSLSRSATARRNSYAGGHAKQMGGKADDRRTSWAGNLSRNLTEKEDPSSSEAILGAEREKNQGAPDTVPSLDDAISSSAEGNSRRYAASYHGYMPEFTAQNHRKLPIIVQFHGGGFVTGSKDSYGNDVFCRQMAKLCDAIVVAVGYRLAPEHKYPSAFDDGFEALSWLAKQANLTECSKSEGHVQSTHPLYRSDAYHSYQKELVDTFCGSEIIEPWLAAHGDPSRCVLLGMSSGGNIADFVARRVVQAGRLLDPIKVVAQVLMYPFFIGSSPIQSEIKMANSYFYDKSTCILAWKLLFSEREFTLDHPVANPLVEGREPALKHMPPTLTVVGELDWMKDRAIAYSEALRKSNLDAPVLEYKDAVHEFGTMDFLVDSRQAKACREDIAIWIKKYISQKGHELSY